MLKLKISQLKGWYQDGLTLEECCDKVQQELGVKVSTDFMSQIYKEMGFELKNRPKKKKVEEEEVPIAKIGNDLDVINDWVINTKKMGMNTLDLNTASKASYYYNSNESYKMQTFDLSENPLTFQTSEAAIKAYENAVKAEAEGLLEKAKGLLEE